MEQVLVTDELLQRIKPLPEYGLEWQRSLSATALQTYLDCPRCYYYQYILQMPGYEAVNAADASGYLPAALQGTVIHKALELLTNGYEQEPAFRSALQAYKVQGSAARTYDMYMQYINGPLYQRLQEAERKAEISFELPLLQEYGITAVFSGYIDCTVFNSDGTLTIVDYKQACRRQQANLRRVIFISWHCIKRQRQNYGSARQHWPNCIFYKIIPAGSCGIAVIGCRKLPNYAEIFFETQRK